jgi:2,3-bisphosphoglycerate-dependent phosphoglycerate mutase
MAVTNVLLVRHAAPVAPSPGASPEVDNERSLTEEGSAAAVALAHRLRAMPIAAVYSSPYRRAIQTIEPLAAALDLEVIPRGDLAERWLADRILDDDQWLGAYRRTWADLDFCPPGGESRRDTQDRALTVLEDLRQRHEGEVVVASTHGGFIGCLLRALNDDLSLEDVLRMPMPAIFSLEHREVAWHASSFAAATMSFGASTIPEWIKDPGSR